MLYDIDILLMLFELFYFLLFIDDKKRQEIYKGFIFFGFKHLFNFGLHLGHIFKKSVFYAR